MILTARVQGGESATARCASTGIVPATPPHFSGASLQAAQTDYPARPQPKNRPEAYPLGYVEDLFEVRTPLGVCFSSLPAGWSKRLSG